MLRLQRYAPALALVVLACSANVGWEQKPRAAAASARPEAEEPPALPLASATPWPSGERSTRVEERQGDPLSMEPGERCVTYRRLPSLSYGLSTLVQDACIEIPNDATLEVHDGATLVIVATNGLRVGKNVRLNARGSGGHRGRRSAYANLRREIGSDAEIQALCVEHGNRCTCPTTSPEAILGQPGEAGSPGGNVRLFVGQLLLSDGLNGFVSDLSGGQGGPPGDSGTQECQRGEVRCSSPACSAGSTFGAPGPAGSLIVAIAGGATGVPIARLSARTTPSGALIVAEVGPSLLQRAVELDQEAMQKGWQRRAGRTL
jgi:hypothetical protein